MGFSSIAPYDVKFSRHNVVAPDLIAVHRKRLRVITELNAEGPPDVDRRGPRPETRRRDLVTKAALYADFGVIEYWVVDPETDRIRSTRFGMVGTACSRISGGFARSEVFPGLKIRVTEIFALPEWWAAKISKETE